jgi:hypothetical protein
MSIPAVCGNALLRGGAGRASILLIYIKLDICTVRREFSKQVYKLTRPALATSLPPLGPILRVMKALQVPSASRPYQQPPPRSPLKTMIATYFSKTVDGSHHLAKSDEATSIGSHLSPSPPPPFSAHLPPIGRNADIDSTTLSLPDLGPHSNNVHQTPVEHKEGYLTDQGQPKGCARFEQVRVAIIVRFILTAGAAPHCAQASVAPPHCMWPGEHILHGQYPGPYTLRLPL